MKSFKEHLLESTLTQEQSKTILGLEGSFNTAELKKAYKSASIKNHPDKGGSAEDMQKVNAAYVVLSKLGGSGSSDAPQETYKEAKARRDSEAQEWQDFVEQEYKSNFDNTAYIDYLSKAIEQELTLSTKISNDGYSTAFITNLWETKDKKIVFKIQFWVSRNRSSGLSDQTSGMKIGQASYATEVLINRKKVKMSQSEFKYEAKTKNVFKDPKVAFPAAKIKKALGDSNKPLKKADYMLTFKSELGAKVSGNDIRIPLEAKDDYGKTIYIWMERSTWMRKGMYGVRAVYNGNGTVASKGIFFKSFFESPKHEILERFVDQIKELRKLKDVDKVIKTLEKFAKELADKSMNESEEPTTFKNLLNEG